MQEIDQVSHKTINIKNLIKQANKHKALKNQHKIWNLTKSCISLRSILEIQIKITKHESEIKKREEKEKKCSAKITLESFDRKPNMESLQPLPLCLSL